MKKSIFTILLLFFVSHFSFGQDKFEPNLVNKFTETNYEQIRSVVDLYLTQILSNPNSKGVIVIHGDKKIPFDQIFF